MRFAVIVEAVGGAVFKEHMLVARGFVGGEG